MILEKTRMVSGNVATTETDLAGRTVKVTDPAGNVTTTSYLSCCDDPWLASPMLW